MRVCVTPRRPRVQSTGVHRRSPKRALNYARTAHERLAKERALRARRQNAPDGLGGSRRERRPRRRHVDLRRVHLADGPRASGNSRAQRETAAGAERSHGEPTQGFLAVTNVGPGTALDAGVTLRFEPVGEERQWRALVMLPNERAEVRLPSFEKGKSPFEIPAAARAGAEVHMTGTARNVYGEAERVDERISFAEWWTIVGEADQRFVEEPTEVALREFKKAREDVLPLRERLVGFDHGVRRRRPYQRRRLQARRGGLRDSAWNVPTRPMRARSS
jgi:hypothetical protein